MSCAAFQELLTGALDGELSQDEQLQLEQHLAECPACRSLQQRLERMEKGFAQLPVQAPPPLLPRPRVTPLPAPRGTTAAVLTIWSTGLLAAACAALLFWTPQPPSGNGTELYFGAHQLQPHHPDPHPVAVSEFRSPPLHGQVLSHHGLAFEIHLDSHDHVCRDLQLEVEYDFDGNGTVDRSEVYASFTTDQKEGWEVYTDQAGGFSHRGEMRDFTGGTVAARLKNASGDVQLLQGDSKLILPHRLHV